MKDELRFKKTVEKSINLLSLAIIISIIGVIIGAIMAGCGVVVGWFMVPLFWVPYFSITICSYLATVNLWKNVDLREIRE